MNRKIISRILCGLLLAALIIPGMSTNAYALDEEGGNGTLLSVDPPRYTMSCGSRGDSSGDTNKDFDEDNDEYYNEDDDEDISDHADERFNTDGADNVSSPDGELLKSLKAGTGSPDEISGADDVYLNIEGTYYTQTASKILNQINDIRLEACNEGIVLHGKALTPADYVPLKWSSNLEAATRKRAMESSLTVAHSTLSSSIDVFDYMYRDYYKGFYTCGENLAWNNNHDSSGITYGINQFYDEKADYLAYLKDGKARMTGHYTNMIDPDFNYVGVAACQMSDAPYGWICIAMQLGGTQADVSLDETKDSSTGKITQKLAVNKNKLSTMGITGSSTVSKGKTTNYTVDGKVSVKNSYKTSTAAYTVPAGKDYGLTWSSSNESILTVNDGTVTGVSGGTAKITASAGDISVSKNVTVSMPIKSISLKSTQIDPGNALDGKTYNIVRETVPSGKITVDYSPGDCTDAKSPTFTSSNTNVVTVASDGSFTVKKPGSSTITVSVKTSDPEAPKVSSSFTLNVSSPLTAIALNKTSATLDYTGSTAPTVKLSVSFTPSDTDSDKTVTWKSDDTSIASVDTSGLVTAVSGGETNIRAIVGSFNAVCKVKVNAPAKTLTLSDKTKKIFTDKTTDTLTASVTPVYTSEKKVIFTSSDPSVFTVSDKGARKGTSVTVALNNGTADVTIHRASSGNAQATLTVTTENNTITKEIPVIIAKATKSLAIKNGTADITGKKIESTVGNTLKVEAVITPADAYDDSVVFESSDTSIASVSSTGNRTADITALREGTATITATNINAPSPVSKTFTIDTRIKVEQVLLDRDSVNMTEGDAYKLIATVIPGNANKTASFTSDNKSVAMVDAYGNITAVSAGTAHITASCEGVSAICTVNVAASEVQKGDTPMAGEDTGGIWVAKQSFKSSVKYTGANITQPDLRVYYKKHRLAVKTDYTLSYKNNKNARNADAANAPMLIVNFTGQYTGQRTYPFTITPVNIGDTSAVTAPGSIALPYNKKVQKTVPVLYYGGNKLLNKTDFTCEYNDVDYINEGVHTVLVKGIGNFTGERTVNYRITAAAKSLKDASVKISSATPGDKKIYIRDGLTAGDLKVVVTIGKSRVPETYYNITSLPDKVGKGTVTIEANAAGKAAGYFGSKRVTITTYPDRNLKDVQIQGIEASYEYDRTKALGDGIRPEHAVLSYSGTLLKEGTDYSTAYASNKKTGKATVTYKGLGRYSGSRKITYKIIPCTHGLTVTYEPAVPYTKGGVTPSVTVKDAGGNILALGKDYTVPVAKKSNLKPGTMKFKVSGKNNYAGYSSGSIEVTITNGDLKNCSMTVPDKAYSRKKNAWKSKVKITDSNGKALKEGTDYDKKIIYAYTNMKTKPVPDAGTTVFVTAIGKGNYAGTTLTGSYRIFKTSISKLTVVIDSMTYTGSELQPVRSTLTTPGQIHLYASAKDAKARRNEILVSDKDVDGLYTIVGYSSNIRSGKGKVTLRGAGNYGDTKTYTFKILKRSAE